MTDHPQGIAGLVPREPYGAVLAAGRKGPKGNPIEKDRFHVLEPAARKRGRDDVRDHHILFRAFNNAPPERRRTVLGQLVHATVDECFTHSMLAYKVAGKPSHPAGVPFCVGNGVEARRYMGWDEAKQDHRFDDIACPHERCEYRQAISMPGRDKDRPAPCAPWMRILFRLVWAPRILEDGTRIPSSLPAMEVLMKSKGWNTVKRALGFFKAIDDRAKMVLGDRPYSLGGFAFSLTISEKTNKLVKSRFPVIDFAPMSDPVDFFTKQLDRTQRVAEILGPERSLLTQGPDTQEYAKQYLAHVPGHTIDVAPEGAEEGEG
jgi:hypothetical protein